MLKKLEAGIRSRIRLRLPAFVKRLTNPVLGPVPIRIAAGPNRGLRWSLAISGSGFRSGKRERKQLAALTLLVRRGDVVWDVGAHYGYLTLCAARAVGATGVVHAFEPSPGNCTFLQRHIDWNRLSNVVVHPYALGASDGMAGFGGGETSKQHKLGGGSDVVLVRTVRSVIQQGDSTPPGFLKIDVEGAEAELLEAGLDALGPRARLMVAIHSEDLYDRCRRLLDSAGYRLVESARLNRYRNTSWRGDADLIAFGPEYADTERDVDALRDLAY